jgi:hypothetical protein
MERRSPAQKTRQHVRKLAGLVRPAAPPVSSPETERTDTLRSAPIGGTSVGSAAISNPGSRHIASILACRSAPAVTGAKKRRRKSSSVDEIRLVAIRGASLNAAPLIRIHGQHQRGALRPGSVGAVTLKAFACLRALAFYRPSIGWSKLRLAVGGHSGDAVWLRRLMRRSEPLGAPHLHYDAPRSEQTRSRPSTASIEAPLHSASASQIGPLETTTQSRGLASASPMGVRTRITNNSSHKGFQTIYAYLEYRSL